MTHMTMLSCLPLIAISINRHSLKLLGGQVIRQPSTLLGLITTFAYEHGGSTIDRTNSLDHQESCCFLWLSQAF